MTKPQKIEGGWEEAKGKLIKSISSSWEYMSEEKVNETIKNWSEFIDKLFLPILSQSQESERQRCVEEERKKTRNMIARKRRKVGDPSLDYYGEEKHQMLGRVFAFEEVEELLSTQARHDLEQMK